jgi:hypothetical protein
MPSLDITRMEEEHLYGKPDWDPNKIPMVAGWGVLSEEEKINEEVTIPVSSGLWECRVGWRDGVVWSAAQMAHIWGHTHSYPP